MTTNTTPSGADALRAHPAAATPDEIEGLRAHVALLKAALAQAEQENDELRAALAAQKEDDALDAARYRWLSAMATQQADYLGPIFRIDVRRSEPYLFNFDAAVDAAMSKEGRVDD